MVFKEYSQKIGQILAERNWDDVHQLARAMRDTWRAGGQLLLCGNGGSAGNAIHLANDYLYGVAKDKVSTYSNNNIMNSIISKLKTILF